MTDSEELMMMNKSKTIEGAMVRKARSVDLMCLQKEYTNMFDKTLVAASQFSLRAAKGSYNEA